MKCKSPGILFFVFLDINPYAPVIFITFIKRQQSFFPSLSWFIKKENFCKPSKTHFHVLLFLYQKFKTKRKENKYNYYFILLLLLMIVHFEYYIDQDQDFHH